MEGVFDYLAAGLAWLLRSSWQGALLVVLILVVQRILAGRLSPQWRHALWGVLILRLLLVWAPPSPLSLYNWAGTEVPGVYEYIPALEMPEESVTATERGPLATTTPSRRGTAATVATDQGFDSGALAGLVWLVVFTSLVSLMSLQSLRFARRVQRGKLVTDSETLALLETCRARLKLSTYLAVVETDCVDSPALMGCVRPRLLMPVGLINSLSREELRYVFLHELAHVKRGDIWIAWLVNLLTAAHWFNPLIWVARSRVTIDREAACDAHVLATLDPGDQRGYGLTLLNLMQRFSNTQWAPGIAGISESNSNLTRRIVMIKDFRSPTRLAAWSGVGVCLLIGLATLTNAQESKSTPQPTPPVAKTPVDIVVTPSDINGYTAQNGGTMISAQITNASPGTLDVEVEFWEGDVGTGKKIGRGGLTIPAGNTGTEAIPWVVENGRHTINVHIDPDNTIKESDEMNNIVQAVITYENGRFSREEANAQQSRGRMRLGGSRRGISPLPSVAPVVRAAADSDDPAVLRAHCQNRLKQLGLVFKMYANESQGARFPVLSQEPGYLMFAWGGESKYLDGIPVLSTDIASEIPMMAQCPTNEAPSEMPDDSDFVYLGYVLRNDKDVVDFAKAYKHHVATADPGAPRFIEDLPREGKEGDVLHRLREGVERFYITDINNPAGSAKAQSEIPIVIEWPDRHPFPNFRYGANILYMDGHVEFVPYPGKWPMTVETIATLRELAGRSANEDDAR